MLARRSPLGRTAVGRRILARHFCLDDPARSAGPVHNAIGAAMLVRREAIRDVGAMDERIFLYGEDLDWCYRMWQRGWEVHVVPEAVMEHAYERQSRRTLDLRSAATRHHWASILKLFVIHPSLLIGRGPRRAHEAVARQQHRRPDPEAGSSAPSPRHPAVQERRPEEVPGHPQAQAQPRVHPRAVLVRPDDGDDGDPVAPPAGEVDELHVEDDAGDPLLGEEVVGRLAGEALEAALGVLDVADRPDRGERRGRPGPAAAGSRAGCAACRCRRAGSGCRGPRRGRGAPRRGAAAGRAGWPCRRRRRWRGRSRRRASRPSPRRPCRRGAPPAAPGAAPRRPSWPPPPGEPGPGRRSRRCCRRRPPGRARRPAGGRRPARRPDPARRAGAGSRTARRGPAPGGPPRCRRAGRS